MKKNARANVAAPRNYALTRARPASGAASFVDWGMRSTYNGGYRAGEANIGAGVNFHC